ncbi:MAG: 50S ribosomal protein L3 [Chitinivibrionales bacterium]|nr:50S ribosomal protein L3 [Chitinivibrionales bacterium]
MMQGLIGKKVGMTRLLDKESGHAIPVTVIKTATNIVHQIKTEKNDGYTAAQLGFDSCPEKKVKKALQGHFKKHGSAATRVIKEFVMDESDAELKPGQTIGIEVFENIKYVDVTGTSKGRGFTGTIKRHNFQRGRETHGNTNHRERGSLGAGTYPARVFPGVKMAGQYGSEKTTIKGLELVGTDKENGLLYIKGAIPGANKGVVVIRKNNSKK